MGYGHRTNSIQAVSCGLAQVSSFRKEARFFLLLLLLFPIQVFATGLNLGAFWKIPGSASCSGTAYTLTCDLGTETTTCTINTTKTIPDNVCITNITGNLTLANAGILRNTTSNQTTSMVVGGTVTIQSGGSINTNITLTAANLVVNNGGTIVADSLGYVAINGGSGTGPGAGAEGSACFPCGGGGGGHGGVGGIGYGGGDVAGGISYDSTTDPTQPGSSGGSFYTADGNVGGKGGGVVRLIITANATVNGSVTAHGGNSPGYGGGGAGGSIYLTAASISSSTSTAIRANGGNGESNGGAGGGGIIAISADKMPQGTITVTQGSGAGYATGGVYTLTLTTADGICDTGTLATTCGISYSRYVPSNYTVTGSGTLNFAGGVNIYSAETESILTLNMPTVTLNSTSAIRTNVTIIATDLTVSSGASILVDSLGYRAQIMRGGAGPGGGDPGTGAFGSGGGGGGHGGGGGMGHISNAAGGVSNDSTSNPILRGSSGGAYVSSSYAGGAGGGIIRIIATNSANIAGTLSANGGNAATNTGGGGSGGSIYVLTPTLTTATTTIIRANGGDGSGNGGGGGGGIIAIDTDKMPKGTVTVTQGTGAGAAGSGVYTLTMSLGSNGLCDSGSFATTCTVSFSRYFPSSYTISGSGVLNLASGVTFSQANPDIFTVTFNVGTFSLSSGSSVQLNLIVNAANLTIANGASVSADNLGYRAVPMKAGQGPGPGEPGTSGGFASGGGGGGHGGVGGLGRNSNAAGGISYDDTANPVLAGSSGSSFNTSNYTGGVGGGIARFIISGHASIDGTISVNGGNGATNSGGGGAGGSIYISTSTLSTASTTIIRANGGNGNGNGGGGGGGIIAIVADKSPTGTIQFNGGTSYFNGGQGVYTLTMTLGENGFCDSGSLATTCVISNTLQLPTNYTSLAGVGTLNITSTGKIRLSDFSQTLTLNLGTLSMDPSSAINGNLIANVTDAKIAGIISSDGAGYTAVVASAGNGPGGGAAGGASGGGGGGHGGPGGSGYAGAAGGISYDDTTNPTMPGSAGGGGNNTNGLRLGGSGGGVIRVIATGAVNLSGGTLTVNGINAPIYDGGGGAGGSIYISAATLLSNSSTTLRANGGNGTSNVGQSGGGGGGGIIAIHADKAPSGTIQVFGGALGKGPATSGSDGIYYLSVSSGEDAICDTGTVSGGNCVISTTKTIPSNYSGINNGSGSLRVASGGLLHQPQNNTMSFTLNSLTVNSGGIISGDTSITVTSFSMGGTMYSSTTINTTSASISGAINADGRGYKGAFSSSGDGTGGGAPGGSSGGGGGGHGGIGGAGYGGAAGGISYDDTTNPTLPGSAGGGGNDGITTGVRLGGSGGGVIRMIATGSVDISTATISANGDPGPAHDGGGGAGGSIYISANTLASNNSTILRANGGAGRNNTFESGGGGGGGIIAVSANKAPSGTVTVNGGGAGASPSKEGGQGVYTLTMSLGIDGICDTGTLATVCVVSTQKVLAESPTISNAAGNLRIRSTGNLYAYNGSLMTVSLGTGTLEVDSSGKLGIVSGDLTISTSAGISTAGAIFGKAVNITSSGNVTIATGGSITADGGGYPRSLSGAAGTGPGAGNGGGGGCSAGGGGHGGAGGAGSVGAGGTANDNSNAPAYGGSSGGSCSPNGYGGAGGGYVKIDAASGTVTVSGTVSADGQAGTSSSGGGAGGGIYVLANTFTGSGSTIRARGGNGNGTGGGGGGGMIKVTATTNTFTGSRLVTKGTGGTGAADGTNNN